MQRGVFLLIHAFAHGIVYKLIHIAGTCSSHPDDSHLLFI